MYIMQFQPLAKVLCTGRRLKLCNSPWFQAKRQDMCFCTTIISYEASSCKTKSKQARHVLLQNNLSWSKLLQTIFHEANSSRQGKYICHTCGQNCCSSGWTTVWVPTSLSSIFTRSKATILSKASLHSLISFKCWEKALSKEALWSSSSSNTAL